MIKHQIPVIAAQEIVKADSGFHTTIDEKLKWFMLGRSVQMVWLFQAKSGDWLFFRLSECPQTVGILVHMSPLYDGDVWQMGTAEWYEGTYEELTKIIGE